MLLDFKIILFFSFLLVFSSASANADFNLQLLWRLDETSGVTAYDSSGNGLDGTLKGGSTFSDNAAPGRIGTGLYFNGQNDYLVESQSSGIWEGYTISLWVKAFILGQPQYCSVFNSSSDVTAGFQIDVTGDNPGTYRYISKTGSINIGSVTTDWVHLAVTYDGSSTKVYYNGSFIDSGSLSDTTYNQIVLGVNRSGGRFFNGIIDDLQIYNRALNNGEIHFIYQSPGTVISTEPVIYNPTPSDGQWDIHVDADLLWEVAGAYLFDPNFNVYFGTDSNSLQLISQEQDAQFYNFNDDLLPGTFYYWRVDIVDDTTSPAIVYPGTVMSFITYDPNLKLINWELNSHYQLLGEYYTPDLSIFSYDALIKPSDQTPSWDQGVENFSLIFDGNTYLTAQGDEYLSISDSDSWTMNFYLQVDYNSPPWTSIVSLGEKNQQHLYLIENNKLAFVYDQDYIILPTVTLYPGQWHMLTVTKSPSQIKIYLDGNEKISKLLPLTSTDELGMYKFLPYYFSPERLTGKIDHFNLYHNVLSNSQIITLADMLPFKADIDNNDLINLNDLSTLALDWLFQYHVVDYNLDDMENLTEANIFDYWTTRNDLPSSSTLEVATSGSHYGSKSLQFTYDFKEARQVEFSRIFYSGIDITDYNCLSLWLYKQPQSSDGTFYCKLINKGFPLPQDIQPLAQALAPGGLDAIPAGQWTQWKIDLGDLKNILSSDARVPSDRITNMVQINFGIFNDSGGTGTILIDDVKLSRTDPICINYELRPGDINGDCRIDFTDYSLFAIDWMNNH